MYKDELLGSHIHCIHGCNLNFQNEFQHCSRSYNNLPCEHLHHLIRLTQNWDSIKLSPWLKIPKLSKQLLFAHAPIFNIRKQDPLFTALELVSLSTFGTDSVVGTWKAFTLCLIHQDVVDSSKDNWTNFVSSSYKVKNNTFKL
jgi:hypothetical protein